MAFNRCKMKDYSGCLEDKYNIPVPRYTSYPTVPLWEEITDQATQKERETVWKEMVKHFGKPGNKLSVYVHLPFCDTLCTYCGCTKKITNNHQVERPYIEALLAEWNIYRQLWESTFFPPIAELHLGGGTPTFFSAQHLAYFLDQLLEGAPKSEKTDFSVEGHPLSTTADHLRCLHTYGFNRLSLGVQDNDLTVQKAINRVQPFQKVIEVTEQARTIGFHSVNFDLVYGLPFQTEKGLKKTIQEVIAVQPDRIAFYGYAHVPWTSRAQRLYQESDLPGVKERNRMYLMAEELFSAAGYVKVGMDHYVLPHDDLYTAQQECKLHRNFMGYTSEPAGGILGLGMSAISDLGDCYAQTIKSVSSYQKSVAEGNLPLIRYRALNETDVSRKKQILDISCNGKGRVLLEEMNDWQKMWCKEMQADGLIGYDELTGTLQLTEKGRPFTRIAAALCDEYWTGSAMKPLFSKAL